MDSDVVIERLRPTVSLSALNDLLVSEYRLKIVELFELNGAEDRNFHVVCRKLEPLEEIALEKNLGANASSSEVHDDVSTQFDGLLKVTIAESWKTGHLNNFKSISKVERVELQMKVASHLRNCGFVCPEAVPSVSTGSLVQQLTVDCDGESVKYLVYLTKYIFGSTLRGLIPLSLEVLFEVGNQLAQLHQSLKDINISQEKLSSASPWSLENTDKLRNLFSEAEIGVADQELASNVLDHFSKNVLSQLSKLPQGVIHGDFHDENILLLKKHQVDTATPPSSVEKDNLDTAHAIHPECIREKYAVIDFGDVSHGPFVFDLAIAMSYFMMCDARPDFMRNVAHFLRGYFTSYKPTAVELRSLFSSVCAAYCRETVLCKYTYIEQCRSNEYLLTTVEVGWRQLKELWTMGEEDVLSVWKETWKKYELDF